MSTTLAVLAAVSAVSQIASGIIQSNAAKSAAKANAAVQREAIQNQERARQEARADVAPQVDIAQRASRTLAGTATSQEDGGLDRTFEDERADFLVAEGERSIDRAFAARGQAFSGAAIEAQGRNATDIRTASTQREVDLLSSLANQGTTASANLANTNAQLTNQTSNSLSSIGEQNAASELDQGAALGGAIAGAGNSLATVGLIQQQQQANTQVVF